MKAIRLPLFGVALLLAGCAADPLPFDGVANVKLLMTSVVEPAAEVYWDAVGTIIDENGIDLMSSRPAPTRNGRRSATLGADFRRVVGVLQPGASCQAQALA